MITWTKLPQLPPIADDDFSKEAKLSRRVLILVEVGKDKDITTGCYSYVSNRWFMSTMHGQIPVLAWSELNLE
jgi:hypothetical protein